MGKNGITGKADIALLAPAPLKGLPTGDLAGITAALGVTGTGLLSMSSLLELEELSALPGASLFGGVATAGVAEPRWLFGAAPTGTSASPSSEGSYSSSSFCRHAGDRDGHDLDLRG